MLFDISRRELAGVFGEGRLAALPATAFPPSAADTELDPGSGAVHAFDADEETVRQLHTDVSSLVQVTLRFQRLLEEFTFGDGGEEAGFERLRRNPAPAFLQYGHPDRIPSWP